MEERGGAPVVAIDEARCDGCGLCLGACPEGALYLVACPDSTRCRGEGQAVVDAALCTGCGGCVVACPTGALALSSRGSPQGDGVAPQGLVPQPEVPVIRVKTQPRPIPLRSRLLPAVGAALAWAGREIVPALAEVALDRLDRWAAESGEDGVVQRPKGESRGAGRGEGRGGVRRQRRRRQGG